MPTIAPVTAGCASTKSSAPRVTLPPPRARELLARLLELQVGEGMRAPEVVFRERVERKAVGEEAARERRPDDDAELVLQRVREQLLLVVAGEHRVLKLQRRDGPEGERPLHELRRMVGQAAVPDLACRDELLERAPRLLDRHVAVGVVELQKVELLAPEPTQALLAAMADRLGAQVHEVVSVVATQRSALGEDEHVLAAGERAADDLLGVPPAVERSRVDPVDAAVQCGVDGPYRIGVVLRSPVRPTTLPAASRWARCRCRRERSGGRSRRGAADP